MRGGVGVTAPCAFDRTSHRGDPGVERREVCGPCIEGARGVRRVVHRLQRAGKVFDLADVVEEREQEVLAAR